MNRSWHPRITIGKILLGLAAYVLSTYCFGQVSMTVRTEPKWLYVVHYHFPVVGPIGAHFDTPEAALQAAEERINQYYYVPLGLGRLSFSGLRQMPGTPLRNGKPSTFIWDVTRISQNGNVGQPRTAASIVMSIHCEPGWTLNLTENGRPIVHCSKKILDRSPPVNACPTVPNPVFVETGVKIQEEHDYVDGNGLLNFTRTWRSDRGRFFDIGQSSVVDYAALGTFTGGCYPGYVRRARNGVTVNEKYCFPFIGVGTNEAFLFKGNGEATKFLGSETGFSSRADLNESLTNLDTPEGQMWEVQLKDGSIETYNSNGQLQKRQLLGGRFVVFSYSDSSTVSSIAPRPGLLTRMTDNFGRSLQFTYDEFDALRTLQDPAGNLIEYSYDEESGNCPSDYSLGRCQRLTSVKFQDGSVRRYHYNESENLSASLDATALGISTFLTGISDENGIRLATYKYDSQGRVTSSGWSGYDYLLSYPSFTKTIVTDPQGTERAYTYKNISGVNRQTGQSQPGGSGCGPASSAITYDANGNVASRTDFNGSKTTYEYDLSRNLETKRVEASGTPEARTISTQWHATYRLPTRIAEPRKVTINTYDTHGNLLSRSEQATSDANGSQGFAAPVVGTARLWHYTYNEVGQVLSTTDPNGNTTDYTYDDKGNLITITNAAEQVTHLSEYDANGRVGRIEDPNGLVTELSYSPRGWLTRRQVGDETTLYDYDGVGQLIKVTHPDGSHIAYTYDDAHRLTEIADSASNRMVYTLDAMGNRIKEEVKDPEGQLARQTTRVYDALNRLQEITGAMQ